VRHSLVFLREELQIEFPSCGRAGAAEKCLVLAVIGGNHCTDGRGRSATIARLEDIGRRDLFRRYSCNATALLC
jgi:hypothetical protein